MRCYVCSDCHGGATTLYGFYTFTAFCAHYTFTTWFTHCPGCRARAYAFGRSGYPVLVVPQLPDVTSAVLPHTFAAFTYGYAIPGRNFAHTARYGLPTGSTGSGPTGSVGYGRVTLHGLRCTRGWFPAVAQAGYVVTRPHAAQFYVPQFAVTVVDTLPQLVCALLPHTPATLRCWLNTVYPLRAAFFGWNLDSQTRTTRRVCADSRCRARLRLHGLRLPGTPRGLPLPWFFTFTPVLRFTVGCSSHFHSQGCPRYARTVCGYVYGLHALVDWFARVTRTHTRYIYGYIRTLLVVARYRLPTDCCLLHARHYAPRYAVGAPGYTVTVCPRLDFGLLLIAHTATPALQLCSLFTVVLHTHVCG